jgi:hypothetical protein
LIPLHFSGDSTTIDVITLVTARKSTRLSATLIRWRMVSLAMDQRREKILANENRADSLGRITSWNEAAGAVDTPWA